MKIIYTNKKNIWKKENEYISEYRDDSSNSLTACVCTIKCDNAYAVCNNKKEYC